MDCPGYEAEGGLGLKVTGGRGVEERGVGVMSIGVSDLRSWRFLTIFSKLSSFCSTVVETSFSSIEVSFSSMAWFLEELFLMLSLMTELASCTFSNSFLWLIEIWSVA